jgi:signal transduction histidine kinase
MIGMGRDWLARITTVRHAPAIGVGLLALAAFGQAMGQAPVPYALLLGMLALAATVPLLFLRPPAAAIAITAANVLAFATSGEPTLAGMAAQLIAVYRVGRTQSPQLGAVLCVPFLILGLTSGGSVPAVLLASLVPGAAGAGIAVRARREARTRTAAGEALADTLSQHTARGERARIARELHDVVAHHISMVVVQAETARLTTPGLPAAGARRFTEIGDTARAGLTEMRRLLGVLREDAGTTVADRHPQPGLPQLAELIDAAREASGVGTRLIVSGPVAEFDPGVELAAYRIVQEALTNARRHAPGAAVDVELRYGDDALRLRIRDNGPGPGQAAAAAGNGLLGMRERALAVGGSLRTGAAPGGGFCVEAVLPAKPEVS